MSDTVDFDKEDVHGGHDGQEARGPFSTFQARGTRHFLDLYYLERYK